MTAIQGGTAELLCRIKDNRNSPSSTRLYHKIWSKVKAAGQSTPVYWYSVVNGSTIKYDTPGQGEGGTYIKRTKRKNGSHDVVQLSNITEEDGGTYRCYLDVFPKSGTHSSGSGAFVVTVMRKIHIS